MSQPTAPPKRILIVRPSALGDVSRSVPALVSLRAAYPNTQIDWLVRDVFADAIAHHPALNDVVSFPRKAFAKFGRSWSVTRQVFQYLDDLKARQYDLVIDLQGLIRSGIFTWATRAAQRVGFTNARELAWLCYNQTYKITATHTVDRMLGLIEAHGIETKRDLRLHVGNADRQWAEGFLESHDLADRSFAIIAPTAMWRSKQWPIERFGALTDRLGGVGIDRAVIVGSPGEIESTRPMFATAHGVPRCDAVGQTSVGQLMGLIERCAVAICNDSAPLHLAIGLGRRCVGFFGPTDPACVGPYRDDRGTIAADGAAGVNYRAQREDQSLIARISVERAWAGVEQVMQQDPPRNVWDD